METGVTHDLEVELDNGGVMAARENGIYVDSPGEQRFNGRAHMHTRGAEDRDNPLKV